MTKFSIAFGLQKTQAELDFVDVDLAGDVPLYLCPYAIQIRKDDWSNQCGDHIRSFFSEVLDALRDGNGPRSAHLLVHLHEPNETRLGQSQGQPRGRGVGNDKANQLSQAFKDSQAFITGVLSDISEAELFIHGIGPDTISDLTTNILRGLLAQYTKEQCVLHDIATQETNSLGPIWSIDNCDWHSEPLSLPHHEGKPILLVPKFSVRRNLSLDSQEFYNHHMVEFLQAEYLQAGGALVQVLKNGGRRVTKKSVKQNHPFAKDALAQFVKDHPQVLDFYKNLKGAQGALRSGELEEGFSEAVFAQALIQGLTIIPAGNPDATRYHKLSMGILTFLFYPSLIRPIKEFEQHNGRKRVDIKYTNAAESGFFHARMVAPQTRAIQVFVECKNYSKEIGNPELDQIQGRFGHQRGWLGILLCRTMDNRVRIINSCKDTAGDGRGYIVVLEDTDLVQMLEYVANSQRSRIDNFLNQRFDEITN